MFEVATLWSLISTFSGRSDLVDPTQIAFALGVPFPGAIFATATYSFGVRALNRRPTPRRAYLLGLGCAGLVVGGFFLLHLFRLPIDAHWRAAELMFSCVAGLLGSVLSVRDTSRTNPRDSRQQFLFFAGSACSFAAVATFFPLVYCPCTGREDWLWYVEVGGTIVWLCSALAGLFGAREAETRVIFVVALLAAPASYFVMLMLSVSR
jgi:hypothetical protein